MQPITWTTGLNNYKIHTLDLEKKTFTTELIDQEHEIDRNLDIIIYENLKSFNKDIEVLYSGGVDSELVLYSCLQHGLPVSAITAVLLFDGAIINTHDVYYSEKFCRQNKIKQYFFNIDVKEFFNSERYLQYLVPYNILQPQVAINFYLIEQCRSFPVIGGDWPWIKIMDKNSLLSPPKLDYNSYERFFLDKNISGVGNMLSYSYELAYQLSKRQLHSKYNDAKNIHLLKHDIYGKLLEVRLRSYGYEILPSAQFDITKYKVIISSKIKLIKNIVIWNNKYKKLLSTEFNYNDKN